MAQIAIFNISESSSYGAELLTKLANGVYQLFKRALNVNLDRVEDRGEIEYLAEYYYVKALLFYKIGYEKIYNERGVNIGIIIALEQKVLDNLKKLERNKNKYGTHEQHSEVTNLLRTIQSEFDNYKYKNNLVNKEPVNANDALANINKGSNSR